MDFFFFYFLWKELLTRKDVIRLKADGDSSSLAAKQMREVLVLTNSGFS